MHSGRKVCKKRWDDFWTQTTTNPDPHQNLIITFWPIYNVPWNLMQIYSVIFALSRENNNQKYAKAFNFLCVGNNDFVKYQAQGGFFNPNPPCVRPWGGVLSSYLFAVYLDDLSNELNNLKAGCCIGEVLLNHLMFADDICVFCPSVRWLQRILDVCQASAESHGIIFNCN